MAKKSILSEITQPTFLFGAAGAIFMVMLALSQKPKGPMAEYLEPKK